MTPEQEKALHKLALGYLEPDQHGLRKPNWEFVALAQVLLELADRMNGVEAHPALSIPALDRDGGADPNGTQAEPSWTERFTVQPNWDRIAPDLKRIADLLEDETPSAPSADAALLRGLAGWYTGSGTVSLDLPTIATSKADERYGAHEAEIGTCGDRRPATPEGSEFAEVDEQRDEGGYLRERVNEHQVRNSEPQSRARVRDELGAIIRQAILRNVWNDKAISAEVDRILDLLIERAVPNKPAVSFLELVSAGAF